MFFENDRTYCVNAECRHTECYRHQANIVGNPRFISIAIFERTRECIKDCSCSKCKHLVSCERVRGGVPCDLYEKDMKNGD